MNKLFVFIPYIEAFEGKTRNFHIYDEKKTFSYKISLDNYRESVLEYNLGNLLFLS